MPFSRRAPLMRGEDLRQGAMFSYISLEERIPSCRRSHRSADRLMTRRSGPARGVFQQPARAFSRSPRRTPALALGQVSPVLP